MMLPHVHRALALVAIILGLAAAVAETGATVNVEALVADIEADRDHISAPELAERIMRQDPSLHVLDLRPRADYNALHIPTARHITFDALNLVSYPKRDALVVYSEGATRSAQAWMLLRLRGYRDVRFLREGIYEWLARVMEPRLASDATEAERAEFARAEPQSRFFGGQPQSNVPRAEVLTGYWTEPSSLDSRADAADVQRPASVADAIRSTVGSIRRRGC